MQHCEWLFTLDSVHRIELEVHFAGLIGRRFEANHSVSHTQIIEIDDLRMRITKIRIVALHLCNHICQDRYSRNLSSSFCQKYGYRWGEIVQQENVMRLWNHAEIMLLSSLRSPVDN
jgi:hypothetical protein